MASAFSFSVCGKVMISALPEGLPPMTRRKLILTHLERKADIVSIATNAAGTFCTQLSPGKYNLKARIFLRAEF